MRRKLSGVVVLASVAGMAAIPYMWSRLGFAIVALGFGAQFLGCRHPGPLGLLPPVEDAAGVRQPARWFCDRCGKAWPAGLERDHAPVPRFTGYDPTKAVSAARRAGELEASQRKLALKRSGVAAAVAVAPKKRPVPAAFGERPGPVPIRGRLAG